jgi:hypothetical protein
MGSLSIFVAFFRTEREQEISAIHEEVTRSDFPAEVSSGDIQTEDDLRVIIGPITDPDRPSLMSVHGFPSSVHGSHIHVLLVSDKSLDVVDGRSLEGFLGF